MPAVFALWKQETEAVQVQATADLSICADKRSWSIIPFASSNTCKQQ